MFLKKDENMLLNLLSNILKKKNANYTKDPYVNTFCEIFQHYYDELRIVYKEKGMSFIKASRLELALYLLFRSDFLLRKSSNPSIRQLFFEKTLKIIQSDISNELLDLCYLRLNIYGEMYNDCKDKDCNIFSKEFWGFSEDWLISAIELCKDDYNLMANKKYIPLSLDVMSNFPIKICLNVLDQRYMKIFIKNINSLIEQCQPKGAK
jgi:hypothetical protein